MKKVLFVLLLASCMLFTDGLAQKFPGIDKSPADIAYFRPDRGAAPVVKVVYSRPQANGRSIFGELIPFDKVWRLGANEATEIRLYKDATIGGKEVKAGTYSIFAIPTKDKWTIILNSDLDQWGAYRYKQDNDVARFEVDVQKTESAVEAFSIAFQKADGGATLVMAWDDTMVAVPIGM